MEISPLAVMLLLISLIPVAHAQGRPKAVVSITPDTHVFTGETVTLRCDVQGGGDTQWTYSWNKNNRLTDRTTQEFRIRSVLHVQHGVYTCRGQSSDSQSSEISDAVTLTVSEKPKPTVRVNPQSSVYTGDTITLTCELQSTGWEIQWYKNNPQLQLLNSEETNTLKMTDDNAGETEYKCRACRRNQESGYYYGYYHYYCTEISDPVNITVRGSRVSAGTVGVAVGLGFLFIALLILMILFCSYKRKKENQTSEQNQIRSGAEDSQSGHTPLQAGSENIYAAVDQTDTSGTGEAAAEIREATYAQVTKKKKTNRNNGADAEPGVTDVTYAEIELKPMTKAKRMKEKTAVGDDIVYSVLQQK